MYNLIIVESPVKARTIGRYLGKDYFVLASFGHVRDLPSKSKMVDTENNFKMHWDISSNSKKHLAEIAKAAKTAKSIILATDPDREGEAIAWHIVEALKDKKSLPKTEIKRIVFHEITKKAVEHAVSNPRAISTPLVESYLARRALDYLVGFTLSPLLWQKVPGARSAGRVQSVALRIICNREELIEKFQSQEYWNLTSTWNVKGGKLLSRLMLLDQKKVEKFSFKNEKEAEAAKNKLLAPKEWHIANIKKREVKRHPVAPFTTSTLQQEAYRKLGFSPSKTMTLAQKLYEGISIRGENTALITYMRTDSVQMSASALASARQEIETRYGKEFVSASVRSYKTKTRNAQEAHECVRAIDFSIFPDSIDVESDLKKLYQLIWRRAIASQMESAIFNETVYLIEDPDKKHQLRSSGRQIKFEGFLKVYREGIDESDEKDSEGLLPELDEKASLKDAVIDASQHFTEPPPRFSDASLIKELELQGIGRPSTYASILKILRDRGYISTEKALNPTSSGRVLSVFLEHYFGEYVANDFTAKMEDQLDKVANGAVNWQEVLKTFWDKFNKDINDAKEFRVSDIIDVLDKELELFLFADKNRNNKELAEKEIVKNRKCTSCKDGRLGLKLSRHGGFIGCSNYPECRYTKSFLVSEDGKDSDNKIAQESSGLPKLLGKDPDSQLEISLRRGPYGFYVHREIEGKNKKGKMASIPAGTDPWTLDLAEAQKLLSLPRDIGKHPETNKPVYAAFGRFGPYVRHEKIFASLPKDITPFDVDIDTAVRLFEEKKNKVYRKRGKAK